jgi:hypothetical protein
MQSKDLRFAVAVAAKVAFAAAAAVAVAVAVAFLVVIPKGSAVVFALALKLHPWVSQHHKKRGFNPGYLVSSKTKNPTPHDRTSGRRSGTLQTLLT